MRYALMECWESEWRETSTKAMSERGFTSKQRKKFIYGREKHRNRGNKSTI